MQPLPAAQGRARADPMAGLQCHRSGRKPTTATRRSLVEGGAAQEPGEIKIAGTLSGEAHPQGVPTERKLRLARLRLASGGTQLHREDDRRHYREIDANISVRTFVLDVAWQKRESGGDVRFLGGRALVREPTDEGKSQYRDNEDLRVGPTGQCLLRVKGLNRSRGRALRQATQPRG
jgi:hypothetical protein